MNKQPAHQVIQFPGCRIPIADMGWLQSRKNALSFLAEIDVTDALRWVREQKAAGRPITVTSWLLKCIAEVLHHCPLPQAMRLGKNKAVVFRDVDLLTVVEKDYKGQKIALSLLIPQAQDKTIEEISACIEQAKAREILDEGDFDLSRRRSPGWMKLFLGVPRFLRLQLLQGIRRRPFERKKHFGTAAVSCIGTTGRFHGWMDTAIMDNLGFMVNSILPRPWLHEGSIQVRDILYLTVAMDHNMIDGGNAARFMEQLCHYLEHYNEHAVNKPHE